MAAALVDWKCPRCRDICNCSNCMKKRGCRPTGILSHTAKANGFSSVSEMLDLRDSGTEKHESASTKKWAATNEASGVVLENKHRKENGVDSRSDSKLKPKPLKFGGDVEKNEKFMTKNERKIDGTVKNPEKTVKDTDASSKESIALDKQPPVAPRRRCIKENGSDSIMESKTQANPLEINGNERKPKNPNIKKVRKAEVLDNSLEDNRSTAKKHWISEEVSKKKEKSYKRVNGGGRLIRVNSEVPVLNKISRGCLIKREDDETEVPGKVNVKNVTNGEAKCKPVNEFHHYNKNPMEVQGKSSIVEIQLPQGIELTNVANVGITAEDIGHALQFLEFCEAFGQVFGLKKGHPDLFLQEIACGQSSCRKHNPSVVQFHIKLLSMIQEDSGKECTSLKTRGRNSWVESLCKCISESQYALKELLVDGVDVASDGYEKLNSSKKLKLLNFLCDEALGTVELRSWIDERNSEFVEEEKKAKEKAFAEKEKEKNKRKKLQDEVARAILNKNGAPLSISEHEALVANIKAEVAQTLAGTLEATDIVMKTSVCELYWLETIPLAGWDSGRFVRHSGDPLVAPFGAGQSSNVSYVLDIPREIILWCWELAEIQRSDAVRSEPMLLDANGQKFWQLRGTSGKMGILLQDVGNGDLITCEERWFAFDVEEKATVEKYISSFRMLKK
ncbi:unnamed protein product [Ilex paraguariensis]|uniref:DDT domain-containing protein n=1 Tax=Ilex paraguariensis TaxID=185542 RepID=A0ABC8S0G7_9AQUA